jgi:putative nucleotidyltransferase with HDIG domain
METIRPTDIDDRSSAERAVVSDIEGVVGIDHVIDAANRLEPLSASVARLAELVADTDVDIRDIVEVISYDPMLTASMLRAANSVTSASVRPVTTVHDAVIRMGTGTVLALALSASVAGRLRQPIPGYDMVEGEMWRHSVTAALAAETLAGWSRLAVPAGAPAAALLHDIGKLVLAQTVSPHMLQLIQRTAVTEGRPLTDVESTVLGINHGQVGGLVALHWRLPDAIVEAIINHHVSRSHTGAVAHVVYLAQAASAELSPRSGDADHPRDPVDPVPMIALGIEPERYHDLLVTTQQRYALLSVRFS